MKAACLALPALLGLAACSGEGNDGKVHISPDLVKIVPWTNAVPPQLDADGAAIVPRVLTYPSIGFGDPDPGSRAFDPEHSDVEADCAPLADVELSGWRHDFEPTGPGWVGVAQFWSAYFDYTPGAWIVPGDAAWYSDTALQRSNTIWGLASQKISETPLKAGPNCGDAIPNEHVLHVRGGRFNNFGGGAEHPLSLDCTGYQPGGVADLCNGDAVLSEVVDISGYDGIAFWARRGPSGAGGIQLGIQTKDTSDYLARTGKLGPQNCQRIKACLPSCDNGAECVPFEQELPNLTTRYRCVPPGAKPNRTAEPSLLELLYPQCGADTCKGPPYFPDPDFENPDDPATCKPYTFSGLEENYWCFGNEPPAAPGERCGDGFVSNVSLSTDWKFYKLPFANFRQVGFAKHVDRFDLKNAYSIAFQFSVGYVDLYVDNVSFYRNK